MALLHNFKSIILTHLLSHALLQLPSPACDRSNVLHRHGENGMARIVFVGVIVLSLDILALILEVYLIISLQLVGASRITSPVENIASKSLFTL